VSNWGEEAKKLTPGGRGVQHILEVGGPNTMVSNHHHISRQDPAK
jgi:hypothetical protein